MKEKKEKAFLQEGQQPLTSPKLSTHPTPLRRLRRTYQEVNGFVYQVASCLMRVKERLCFRKYGGTMERFNESCFSSLSLGRKVEKGGNLFLTISFKLGREEVYES